MIANDPKAEVAAVRCSFALEKKSQDNGIYQSKWASQKISTYFLGGIAA